MYIVFEAIATNSPLWIEGLERFSDFWSYTVAKIDDSKAHLLNLKELKAEEISEKLARASMLAGSANGKIAIKSGTPQVGIVLDNQTGEPDAPKVYYELTEEDHRITAAFIKKVLVNYSNNHAPDINKRDMFNAEVEKCNTIEECNWVMYNYLDVSSYNTFGDKTAKFSVAWN